MTCKDMTDFMTNHCCEFVFRFKKRQEAAVDEDVAIGCRKRIHCRAVNHEKVVRLVSIG